MIDIETHKIIDMIESRQEDDVTEWLKTYTNLEIISRDGGIVYKASSDKAHPKAKQMSDRFHVLKNLTDYTVAAIKRLLKSHIEISEENKKCNISKIKKKYEFKIKWDLIIKVKELREQKHRVIDISQALGISKKTVIQYNKIPLEDKEKYNQISIQELKTQVSQINKWELIQKVQKEYKKVNKYSVVARKYNIDERTVKKYLSIKETSINGNKNKEYHSKLNLYKNRIIEMNEEGLSWKKIYDEIKTNGYTGSESLLRKYLSRIKKENITAKNIENIVERTTMISLLYKEIEDVKEITKELFDKVITMSPKVGNIYETIKRFKEIMFSKNDSLLET